MRKLTVNKIINSIDIGDIQGEEKTDVYFANGRDLGYLDLFL